MTSSTAFRMTAFVEESFTCIAALGGLPDVTLTLVSRVASITVAAAERLALLPGTPGFVLRVAIERNSRPAFTRIHLLFTHFSYGSPNVDAGILSGASFTTVFTNVAVGNFAAPMGYEPVTRYLPTAPLDGAILQVRAA